MIAHRLKINLMIAVFATFSSFAATAALVNGSLTGPVAGGAVPAGWSLNSVSPDTTSSISQPFAFNVNPGDSPDGGTWVGLARDTSLFESFGQTVTDFIIGETYDISWYGVNTGCCNGAFSSAAEILLNLDGVLAFTGATHAQDGIWYQESHSFVATSTTQRIDFRLATGINAYVGIDGINLSRSTSVPIPGILVLLGLGLVGLGWARRKVVKS